MTQPEFTIRPAEYSEVPRILEILEGAKRYMRAEGNMTQWAEGPGREEIENDIDKKEAYVLLKGDEIAAFFVMMKDPEPSYAVIDGAWPDDLPYATLHRVASAGIARRVLEPILAYTFDRNERVRIDTHEDNKTMRRAIERNGFSYCGVVTLADGSPRFAYAMDRATYLKRKKENQEKE